MISAQTKAKYQPTIGIESHVQLKTVTKLFESVGNDAREAAPNTLVSHISFGLPGALPVLNQEAVRLASRMALALKTEPQRYSIFERKHYFYPDLPMGYQISQLHQPIVVGGEVDIDVDGEVSKIRINRVQIEADAGKNTHPAGQDYSLVDLNRAGTPLLEIVSEPDLKSAAAAKAYARELYLLVRYANISDADLYHGNMRFDVNVSISPNDRLGTRTETKNLNSFRSVEKAIEFEIERQIELLEAGQKIVQETRGWDEAKQKTFSQRGKEEAHDYRYMPDPDLPPITLDDAYIADIRNDMPSSPKEIRQELAGMGLDRKVIEEILDNQDIYNKIAKATKQKALAENIRRVAYDSLEKPQTLKVKLPDHLKIAESFRSNSLSSTTSTYALEAMVENPDQNVDQVIAKFAQVSDEGELIKIVEKVLAENAKAVEAVAKGEMKVIAFLVGQVMKASQGKANPGLAQALIKKQLGLN